MNILHINSYFSTSGLFRQLYDRQIRDGIKLDVYVPISHQFPQERIAASGDYAKVVRTFPQITRWVFPLKHQAILKNLLQQYHFEDYNLIHAHSLFSNGWLALQLHERYQIPYVVSVRNADLRTFFDRMPWMRSLGIKILRSAQHIVFISKNTQNEVFNRYIPKNFKEKFLAKTSIIPNGVDNFWHENRNTQTNLQIHNPIRIVTTGKIMRTKLFIPMAEKLQLYSDTIQPLELHIIGPTWEEDVLKELQTIPIVTYHGKMSKEEMRDFYRESDIFALLSSPETFGLVYVEAMSQALPVIYTKGEGFDNFFPNHTVGVSVDRHSQADLNQAIGYIIKHYQELSLSAVNEMQSFNWEDIHSIYLDLYHKLNKERENE